MTAAVAFSDEWGDEPTVREQFRVANGLAIATANKDDVARRVLRAWEKRTNLPWRTLRSGNRHRSMVRSRWAVMVALRQLGFSLPEIGDELNRDHSTVLHGLRSARKDEYLAAADLLRAAGIEPVVEVAE